MLRASDPLKLVYLIFTSTREFPDRIRNYANFLTTRFSCNIYTAVLLDM